MAEDVLVLLNHFEWTELRQLHIVGISMGGMIAQGEVIHEVICSDMQRS